MEKIGINISRFNSIISKIEPLYKEQHKEGDIEAMKKMVQKASVKMYLYLFAVNSNEANQVLSMLLLEKTFVLQTQA